MPRDYRMAIVPASDTGAVEMALWSLLGARGVDVLAWESFGKGWAQDVTKELKLSDVRVLEAPYGKLPELAAVDFGRDVVFTWNGTTSGVRVPDGDWIDAKRAGLTICDATSAAFAMALPWDKLDVVTYSWQKVLGGEAQHGMLVLSPRAVERLQTLHPALAAPEALPPGQGRQALGGRLQGRDHQHPLHAVRRGCARRACLGGAHRRAQGAHRGARRRISRRSLFGSRARRGSLSSPRTRAFAPRRRCVSPSPIRRSPSLPLETRAAFASKLTGLLEEEAVAYDINAYREAPPGLRIWAGATVERADLEALFPWLDWAFESVRSDFAAARVTLP